MQYNSSMPGTRSEDRRANFARLDKLKLIPRGARFSLPAGLSPGPSSPPLGAVLLLLAAAPLGAQTGWFQPSLLEKPEMKKALQSVDDRAAGIVDEWIRVVEIPAPSTKEQARAKYIRAEMEKLGLTRHQNRRHL